MKRPIAFLLETGSRSGGVRVIGELANRLSLRDWEVSIWSPNPKESMSWFPLNPKIKWHSFFRTGTLHDYEQLSNVLKKQDCIKIATFFRTALVLNECSTEGQGYYLIQDREDSYATQPVFKQQALSTYEMPFRKFTTSKWVESVIPNTAYIGIGLENKYRPANKNVKRKRNVLACERVQNLKGYDIFCEIARYLYQMNIPVETYGMDEKPPLLTKVEHHQSPTDDQVRRMLQECGIFLSQSRHEGFNLTALEAMACGTPVVTTDSDGNREYIEHESNCLVSNDPIQLAVYCWKLFQEPDLYKKLSANGPKTAERYRWNPVVDRLERILLE